MTWDWISYILGVLTGLGILTVGIYFGADDWFK